MDEFEKKAVKIIRKLWGYDQIRQAEIITNALKEEYGNQMKIKNEIQSIRKEIKHLKAEINKRKIKVVISEAGKKFLKDNLLKKNKPIQKTRKVNK